MASLTMAVQLKQDVKSSGYRVYYICSLNLRIPQRWVETILRVGGEDLCFICTRKSKVL